MKKLLFTLLLIVLLSSCVFITSVEEDIMFLQTRYPKAKIYRLDSWNHLVMDTLHIYKIHMTNDGKIKSIIKLDDK